MPENIASFLSSADFFFFFKIFKNLFQEYHQFQTVWIQIRTEVLPVQIWVQNVCKDYQQTALEFILNLISGSITDV